MSDDDGDEKQSRRTEGNNICIRRTLILVPHWHTDSKQTKKSMWEWSQNKDGNIISRRQITKSSCQTTMAMTSDRNGRCDSVFIHIEPLTLVPHWHIDFLQEHARIMCRDGSKTKMETK